MVVRQETPEDYGEVYELVKRAFATTDYSDGTEQDYLNEVRKKDGFIPELSLVAVEGSKIVGQIVLYKTRIDCGGESLTQLVLSPISVLPELFGHGIGSELIARGCKKAAELGYKAVFLCGDPRYYSRFGFAPTYKREIFHVRDAEKNAEWCMVKELENGFLSGVTGTVNIE